MKTLRKTALVLAAMAAVALAVPAAARGPGMGWGAGPGVGLNPDCPYAERLADGQKAMPMRPMMMRRLQATGDGTATWTCPRLGGQAATVPDGAKVPGVCDGTGPWWPRQATPERTD